MDESIQEESSMQVQLSDDIEVEAEESKSYEVKHIRRSKSWRCTSLVLLNNF